MVGMVGVAPRLIVRFGPKAMRVTARDPVRRPGVARFHPARRSFARGVLPHRSSPLPAQPLTEEQVRAAVEEAGYSLAV
jgi:hypothetical protein